MLVPNHFALTNFPVLKLKKALVLKTRTSNPEVLLNWSEDAVFTLQQTILFFPLRVVGWFIYDCGVIIVFI